MNLALLTMMDPNGAHLALKWRLVKRVRDYGLYASFRRLQNHRHVIVVLIRGSGC